MIKINSELESLAEFEAWSGGKDTLQAVIDAGKLGQLDMIAEEIFPEGCTDTELNDWLWFDSDFIFENRKKLHRKILRAIRNNMEELGMNPDDGMVEKRYASLVKEFHPEASHQEMYYSADDDAIEYTITL